MKIIKCDRCKKELNWIERRHAQIKYRGDYYVLAEGHDFCVLCRKELEDMFYKNELEFEKWLRLKEDE